MGAQASCKSCASSNLMELIAEVCLLFPGIDGLKSDPIFAFPKVLVCADRGCIQARLTEKELEAVRQAAVKIKATCARPRG